MDKTNAIHEPLDDMQGTGKFTLVVARRCVNGAIRLHMQQIYRKYQEFCDIGRLLAQSCQ